MEKSLNFDETLAVVDEPAGYEQWRADFERSAHYVNLAELQLPAALPLRELCTRNRFPPAAVASLVAQRATWDEPRVRRLGAHVQWLIAERYTPAGYLLLGWPAAPAACPLLYAYAAMGLLGRTAAAHRELGVAPEITAATLWDVGQQVALHRRIHGRPGMVTGFWIAHHLSGHLFRLGRLQFQRSRAGVSDSPIPPDEPFLDVHIPEDGPLSPAACDESFAAARPFFARHFPAERPRWFACSSWLLDPQLAELLPESSNIVRFQRRFTQVRVYEGMPSRVFEFVFDRPDLDLTYEPVLDGLPRTTRLERALLDHYASGRRIWPAFGVIPIE